jgi:hypothetical protein
MMMITTACATPTTISTVTKPDVIFTPKLNPTGPSLPTDEISYGDEATFASSFSSNDSTAWMIVATIFLV